MPDIKTMLTDLPTSIRLEELGVEQKGIWSWFILTNVADNVKGEPKIVETDFCLKFPERIKKSNLTKPVRIEYYSAFTLSEVLELIDWSNYDICSPVRDNVWWVCGMEEDFEGTTLLEAATKALIHQLEK